MLRKIRIWLAKRAMDKAWDGVCQYQSLTTFNRYGRASRKYRILKYGDIR